MRSLFTNERLSLGAGQVVSGVARRAETLRIMSGRVWITVEGIDQDYFLRGGDSFTAVPNRLIVVEAVQDASMKSLRQRPLQQLAGIVRKLLPAPAAPAVQRRQADCNQGSV